MSELTADGQDIDEQAGETAQSDPADAAADNVRPMDRAKKKVTAAVGEARERFQHAASDASDRFQQASATAKERSERAREAARERYQVTSAQVQDGYTRVRKDVDYMVDDVNDFVREKPGTAVMIAAGAGFLLGLLFRPRR